MAIQDWAERTGSQLQRVLQSREHKGHALRDLATAGWSRGSRSATTGSRSAPDCNSCTMSCRRRSGTAEVARAQEQRQAQTEQLARIRQLLELAQAGRNHSEQQERLQQEMALLEQHLAPAEGRSA